jgi:hypothetical protein
MPVGTDCQQFLLKKSEKAFKYFLISFAIQTLDGRRSGRSIPRT